jgi:hypothetical protein
MHVDTITLCMVTIHLMEMRVVYKRKY